MDGEFKNTGMTPQELWRSAMPPYIRCGACGAPHNECVIRIVVLADPAEYERRYPKAAFELKMRNFQQNGVMGLPLTNTAFEQQMVKITDIGACSIHRKEAEAAAARSPDWCHTHIDRGPVGGPEKPRLVVPVSLGFDTDTAAYDRRLQPVARIKTDGD